MAAIGAALKVRRRKALKRMARVDHAELMTFEGLPEAVSTLLERMKAAFGATGDSRSV